MQDAHGRVWKRTQGGVMIVVPLFVVVIALFANPTTLLAKSSHVAQAKRVLQSEQLTSMLLHNDARQVRVSAEGEVYTLRATEIIGTNAHLTYLPNLLYPALTFTASTIYGFNLSHPFDGETLTISSGGVVTTTGTTIKTSILNDVVTGLQSFVDKADLLILAAGGTVKTLVMTNVTLIVDESIALDSIDIPQFQFVVG
jgi:hypothetical protein